MQSNQSAGAPSWPSWINEMRVHVWTAFVAACLEATAFFAFFDPLMQGSADQPPAWLAHRASAYALGLLLFWIFTLGASALNAYLSEAGPMFGAVDPQSREPS